MKFPVAEARRPTRQAKKQKHTPFGVCFLFGGEGGIGRLLRRLAVRRPSLRSGARLTPPS